MEVEGGLVMVPGTSVAKVVQSFEQCFGTARAQKVPCDPSLQLVDNSQKLDEKDSSNFRSVVGLCLYVARERPDLMFGIKELAALMSSPTVVALQHLRKLIGFMKHVGDVGIFLPNLQPGIGKFQAGGDQQLIIESFSDADWSSNKSHRRSTSCGVHLINGAYIFGSSRSQKVISLSSCESELHALVSTACDGIFIKACAEFSFNAKFQHVVYTDSSSARQLAHRQGSGRIRHVSGKILWIQMLTQDGTLELRQVGTHENLADIATKCLTRERLFFLMNESGMVFLPSYEPVGAEESWRHSERIANKKQMKQIARMVLQMSLALGLEPVRLVGATAQKCDAVDDGVQSSGYSFSGFFMVCLVMVTLLAVRQVWRIFLRKFGNLESRVERLEKDLSSAEHQLADHYEFAANLGTRLTEAADQIDRLDDAAGGLATRTTTLEQETAETMAGLEDYLDTVRFGLMEIGGFVRYSLLSRDQRQSMMTQERANFVMWSHRTRAENTDPISVPEQYRENQESAEEEIPTDDEPVGSPGSMTTLLENLRTDQNAAQCSFVLMCLNGFDIILSFFSIPTARFSWTDHPAFTKWKKNMFFVQMPVQTFWVQTWAICEDPIQV